MKKRLEIRAAATYPPLPGLYTSAWHLMWGNASTAHIDFKSWSYVAEPFGWLSDFKPDSIPQVDEMGTNKETTKGFKSCSRLW